MKILRYILLVTVFISCSTEKKVPEEVSDYLAEVLDLLERKSINKNEIDWNKLRDEVFKKAQNSKNIADSYSAIGYAISELKDNHSYFKPVSEPEAHSANKPLPILSDEITPDDIGYVRIPFCIGGESEYAKYISEIRTKIEEQANAELKEWIVDLRGNFGGNMWPMLLSIEPLMGNGTLGYFVDADNVSEAWKIMDGEAYIGDELIMETNISSTQDFNHDFLAVLTNSETASSGEAIAVAFKFRKNSKSFGKPTFGVSTGCVSHQLSDGSVINLAQSVFADRKMIKYGNDIKPDFEIEENQALDAAVEWIYKMDKNHRQQGL